MDMHTVPDLRYPIGTPNMEDACEHRDRHVRAIAAMPELFAAAYRGLKDAELNTPYRDGGWTLRQLAHHVSDSHMHAFLRVKFALTENWPEIKPYDEKRWAETAEAAGSVEAPLALLAALHTRWVALLDALAPAEWERGVQHPERGRMTVAELAALYAWHGRHHTAHVTGLRQRMRW